MFRTRWSLVALCLIPLLGSCSARTELIVGITTDLVGVADPLTTVQFVVQRDGRTVTDQTWDVGPSGSRELPGSVGIYTGDGSAAHLVIEMAGTLQSGKTVKRDAIVDLPRGSTLFMRMMLSKSCVGKPCEDGTCVEGQCRPLLMDPSQLPAYQAGMELGLECDSGSMPLRTRDGQKMEYRPGPDPKVCGERSACIENTCYRQFATCSNGGQGATEVNLATDVKNCGGCGVVCPALAFTSATCAGGACGFTCLAGRADCDNVPTTGCEVDTTSDLRNCGQCGNACAAANASVDCVKGACVITKCAAGYGDCDGKYENGCEATTSDDANNCGKCGTACAAANGQPICAAGQCGLSACTQNFADCDKLPADGCETALLTDTLNCGACGRSCSTPNATAACVAGACVVMDCKPGFGDCDKQPGNGCETDITTNPDHCGGCGMSCSGDNIATRTCTAGKCSGTCKTGFADCNTDKLKDGCEIDTTSNGGNCGKCGMACPMGQYCVNGTCGACNMTSCGQSCVDMNSNVSNCGACGNRCSVQGVVNTCAGGKCGWTNCQPGYFDCNGNRTDGCEKNSNTDPDNCGGCGNVCSSMGISSRVCSGGKCVGSCAPGTGDCNTNKLSDGCEATFATDAANCGQCGSRCSSNHVPSPTCAGSACNGACATGYADCNNNKLTDGCETDIRLPSNCGGCGKVCPSQNGTPVCTNGACTITCNPGWADCNLNAADGCETNTNTDIRQCGGCKMACAPTGLSAITCTNGACGGTCLPGWADCNKNLRTDGCEAYLPGSDTNCGACGVVCGGIKHCRNGKCAI